LTQSVTVGKSAEVPEGAVRSFEAGGRRLAILRAGGVLHAMDGVCPHRGGPLGEGTVEATGEGAVLTCPWHGWRFDARSGKCMNLPGGAQTRYPVREEGGDIVVEV